MKGYHPYQSLGHTEPNKTGRDEIGNWNPVSNAMAYDMYTTKYIVRTCNL